MTQPANPAYQRAFAMTLLATTATSLFAAALGGTVASTLAAFAYLIVSLGALRFASWIPASVVVGQFMAAVLLLAPGGPPLLLVAPVVSGVIAGSEFLAVAARLDAPEARPGPEDIRTPFLAASAGSAVFVIVLLASRLPGPAGLPSVMAAAGVCVLLALVLTRRAAHR